MKKEKQPLTKSDKVNAIRQKALECRNSMTQSTYDNIYLASIILNANGICHTIMQNVKEFLQQFNFLTVAVVGSGWIIKLK